jgi:hypothetical protein
MARVILRPTVSEDLSHLIAEPLPFRIRCITAVLMPDAEVQETSENAPSKLPEHAQPPSTVIGIGGVAFLPGGLVWAFVQQSVIAKRYPLSFHRAGLMAMQMVRESGLREVVATADAGNAAALRWLRRLGFVEADRQNINDKVLFIRRWT